MDVVILQETKVRNGLTNVVIGGYAYHASPTEMQRGVGIAIREELVSMLDGGRLLLVSERMMVAKMNWGVIVGAYAPINGYNCETEEKDEFDKTLRALLERHRHRHLVLAGDFNATMTMTEERKVLGKNDNGERFEAVVEDHELQPQNWRWQDPEDAWTWAGTELMPGKRTLDWIAVSPLLAPAVTSCEAVEAFDTDHKMVLITLLTDFKAPKRPQKRKKNEHRENPNNPGVEKAWNNMLAKRPRKKRAATPKRPKREFITEPTWALIQAKYDALARWKAAKGTPEEQERHLALADLQKQVKQAVHNDRMLHWEKLAATIQEQAAANNSTAVFRTLRAFYKPRPKRRGFTRSQEEMNEGAEHFRKLLTDPATPPIFPAALPSEPRYVARPTLPPAAPGKLTIFTDGSAKTEAGETRVGYGVHFPAHPEWDESGRCAEGEEMTPLRGELWAVWRALEKAEGKAEEVEVVTDNQQVQRGLGKAMTTWVAANFDHVPQGELWRQIARLARRTTVTVRWVPAHDARKGRDAEGNGKADRLAKTGRNKPMAAAAFDRNPLETYAIDETLPNGEEILNALLQLNANGAPGVDGITASEIRESEDLKGALVHTIQGAWRTARVPKDWATARLVAIPKKSGATKWSDHRGITLLVVASKVLTRLLLQRMTGITLSDWQFGFRRGRDTGMAIAAVRHLVDETRRTNGRCSIAFIDLQKAYDSVDRVRLWQALQQFGIGGRLVELMQQLYDDEVIVNVDGEEAGRFSSTAGVRQGCILSPLFFNIALELAMSAAWPKMRGIKMQTPKGQETEVKVVAYADDVAVVAKTRNALQANLEALAAALAALGLTISVDKTKTMTLTPKAVQQQSTAAVYAARCEAARQARGEQLEEATKAVVVEERGRMVVHWISGPHICPLCDDYTTDKPDRLRTHIKNRHKENKYSVTRGLDKYVHLDYALDLEGKQCKWCNKTFSAHSQARKHIDTGACRSKPGAKAVAEVKRLADQKHWREKADARLEGLQCRTCKKSYASLSSARKHVQESECGKTAQAAEARGQMPPQPTAVAAPPAPAPRALCRHRCKNKAQCAHACCKKHGQEAGKSQREDKEETDEEEAGEVCLYGKPVEEVDGFKYLGRVLRRDGEDGEEIAARIRAARTTMVTLQLPLHKRTAVAGRTKLAVFRAVTMAVLLYGCQTWTPKEKDWLKLQSFEMQQLRRILGWKAKLTPEGLRYPKNSEVLLAIEAIAGHPYLTIRELVRQRQVRWWGMVLRMGADSFLRQTLVAARPEQSRVGWKTAGALVPSIRRLAQLAELGEEERWDRPRWKAAAAPAEEAAAGSGSEGEGEEEDAVLPAARGPVGEGRPRQQ